MKKLFLALVIICLLLTGCAPASPVETETTVATTEVIETTTEAIETEVETEKVIEVKEPTAPSTEAEVVETEELIAPEAEVIETEKTTAPSTKAEVVETEESTDNNENISYYNYVTETEICMLAYLVDKEAGIGETQWSLPDYKREAIVWVVLNRVDDTSGSFPNSVYNVLYQKNQFRSYYGNDYTSSTYNLVCKVLTLWAQEKTYGYPAAGRSLPREYKWYSGDGSNNWFRTTYPDYGVYWDWSWS